MKVFEGMESGTLRKPARTPLALTGAILCMMGGFALSNGCLSVMMDPIGDEFRLSGAALGVMTSMFSGGRVLALVLAPFFQGRVHKLRMLLLSAVLQIGMILLTGAAPSYALLAGCCLVLGLGGGGVSNYANSSLMDLYAGRSAQVLGVLHGSYSVVSLATPLLLSVLLVLFTWRQVFFLAAGAYAIAAFAYLLMLPRALARTDVAGATKEKKLTGAMIKGYLARPRNLSIIAAAALYAASQEGVVRWIKHYQLVRFSAEELGILTLTLFWVGTAISRFLGPRLKAPHFTLFIGGILVGSAVMAAGVFSANPMVLCAAVALSGLLSGLCVPEILCVSGDGYAGNTSLPATVLLFSMSLSRMVMPVMLGWAEKAVSPTFAILIPVIIGFTSALCGFAAARMKTI